MKRLKIIEMKMIKLISIFKSFTIRLMAPKKQSSPAEANEQQNERLCDHTAVYFNYHFSVIFLEKRLTRHN